MYDMNLYYLLYPFVGILSTIGIILKREKLIYKVLSIVLTVIAIFKFDHGYDYFWYWIVGYKPLINSVVVIEIYEKLEIGIQFVYKIVRILGHPQYFFIITGLIISYFTYKIFERESKIPLISLILFLVVKMGFYDFNFYIMQHLGMSLIFYNTHYILENKKYKFILIVILCTILFHSSNIIALSYLFIPKRKISLKKYFIGIVGIVIFFRYGLKNITIKLFPEYIYLFYFKKNLVKVNIENIKFFIIILLLIICINILKKIKLEEIKKEQTSKKEQFYNNIFIIGLIITVMLAINFGGDLSKRIGSYYLFFGYISLSNRIYNFKEKLISWIKIFIVITFIGLRIFLIIKYESFYLNKKPYINTSGDFIARPNSTGLRLFFGKKYEDMSPYLPGEKKFYKN